ncbi:unnamed protein product [Lupinus luteus]|uniref:Uncharacterized protein n=1 Tax=Lupinus luteus TaxID=3873 RepID=A0AAV1YH91_LUPLU
MHLWPSKNLRDSFKLSYLKNLEWNYRRMEKDKQSSNEQKLLEEDENKQDQNLKYEPGVVASICQELLLVFSCCYCCFCCGACVEEK